MKTKRTCSKLLQRSSEKMELSKEIRWTKVKDIAYMKDQIEYMLRETVDYESLSDTDLMELHEYVSKLWFHLICKSEV
jgi:succinylglutamate desuccinylase